MLNRRAWRFSYAACTISIFAGCGWPNDQRGALEEVSGHTMLVGVLGDADQMAAERPVLESLAKDLHAFLEYVPGETSELVAALEQGRIHLIASLPGSSPYSKSVGFSRKYCNHAWEERERVWGIRQGENAFLLEIDEALEAVRCP